MNNSKAEKMWGWYFEHITYIVDTYVSYDDMYSHKYEIIYYSKKNV